MKPKNRKWAKMGRKLFTPLLPPLTLPPVSILNYFIH